MTRAQSDKSRAWQALDLGPLWMVQGPSRAEANSETAAASTTSAASPLPDTTGESTHDSNASSVQTAPEAPGAPLPSPAIAGMAWGELQSAVAGCQRCALSTSRTNTVFGIGDEKPKWLIVGEAPGANEDQVGEPFVGEAGQLLDAMLASVGVSRSQSVFILNVLKCRPPGNRDPQPEEVASCSEFLQRQIAVLQPRLILAMGRFAAQSLLKSDASIGSLRNTVHRVDIAGAEYPLVVGYHPAYLLRRPEEKIKAWQDLCLARSTCDPALTGLL